MKNLILIIFVCMFIMGCARTGIKVPDATVPTGENFDITFLFEYKGVEIYRFTDGGRYRYFSIGNGSFQPQEVVVQNKNSKTYYIDGVLDK